MTAAPTPGLTQLIATVRRFADEVVAPLATQPVAQQTWAGDALRKACLWGLAGIEVPLAQGGLGLPFSARVSVAQELAAADFAFAFAFINHHNAILRIAEKASPLARQKYVSAMLAGTLIGCTAMSEDSAGSDFTAINLQARRIAGGGALSGAKAWIASAQGADIALVFAQTDPVLGSSGIACFIVDLNHTTCRRVDGGSMDGLALAGIGGFALDGYVAPDSDVLYAAGEGFRQAMAGVNKARVHIAAMASGLLQGALEQATAYTASRMVFGQPVINQQGLRWSLVDVAMTHDILRMLTDRAAALIEQNAPQAMNAAASAKLYAGQESLAAVGQCIQAMGARGLTHRLGLTRKLMAAQALCLADGSNEIMRDRLGASLVQRYARSFRQEVSPASNNLNKDTFMIEFPALYITKDDSGLSRAAVQTLSLDDLPEADVLVRISHSTLNYKDALALTGNSPVVRKFPMVPGIDFAGIVERSADPRFKPGDAVLLNGWGAGENHWGGLAGYASVKGDWLIALPDGMTALRAMSIGTAGYTAMLCVMALERHGLAPDAGPVLVTGANGGVGTVAIALLARLGYLVTASTGRPEEADYLKALGASAVMDRRTLGEAGKPLQKESWAAAVDCVGSHTLANVLASTRYGGVVAACGLAQGMDLPASVAPFILRGITLAGIDSVYAPLARRVAAWARLATDLQPELVERNTRVIGLAEALTVAPSLLAGQVRGRVVVDVHG